MRDEVREFKRSRVIDEALKLFFEQGYEQTNVDDIAARLSLSKPSIYTLFESKRAILQAIYERSTNRLVEQVKAAVDRPGPPADRLRAVIVAFVKENIDHQVSSGVFLREEKRLSPEQLAHTREAEKLFDSLLADLIESGVRSGDFSVPDAKIASLAISGMVRWVHRWYNQKGRTSREDIADVMAQLGLNLVGWRPGRRGAS